MEEAKSALTLAFKAVAMAVISIIFTILQIASLELFVVFFAIGLLALSIASIIEHRRE